MHRHGFFVVVVVAMVGGGALLNASIGESSVSPATCAREPDNRLAVGGIAAGRPVHLLMEAVRDGRPPALLTAASSWLSTPLLLRPAVALWWVMLALASPVTATAS